jgi:hypothetical protein
VVPRVKDDKPEVKLSFVGSSLKMYKKVREGGSGSAWPLAMH